MSKYISINNYKTRHDWWYSSCFLAITVAHAKIDYFSNNNNTDKEKKRKIVIIALMVIILMTVIAKLIGDWLTHQVFLTMKIETARTVLIAAKASARTVGR